MATLIVTSTRVDIIQTPPVVRTIYSTTSDVDPNSKTNFIAVVLKPRVAWRQVNPSAFKSQNCSGQQLDTEQISHFSSSAGTLGRLDLNRRGSKDLGEARCVNSGRCWGGGASFGKKGALISFDGIRRRLRGDHLSSFFIQATVPRTRDFVRTKAKKEKKNHRRKSGVRN